MGRGSGSLSVPVPIRWARKARASDLRAELLQVSWKRRASGL